jgi:hypothetical protein
MAKGMFAAAPTTNAGAGADGPGGGGEETP